jgi:hypothetical protein
MISAIGISGVAWTCEARHIQELLAETGLDPGIC